ncbi:RHS repeat domain-containing protein [Chryseolinea lacunae]|nr:RHS repeat-associated core domain-containing protein [Chryseolinea lacunae]
MVPIPNGFGSRQISTIAKETGADVPHERLAFDGTDQIVVKEPGYAYIYLSNENDTPVDVFFDDFKVEHLKSNVVSSSDFYPFGLTANSYQQSNTLENNYLFGGKEKRGDLELDIYDFQTRQYNPSVGRFMSIDPAADIMRRYSPYCYAFDNPMRFSDPDGMVPADGVYVDRKRFDKNGRQLNQISFRRAVRIETTVTIHNAKIVDKSSGDNQGRMGTKAEVKEAGETMAREMKDTWNKTETDKKGRVVSTKVEFTGEITVVDDERAVKPSEFLMVINSDSDKLGQEGEAQKGSNKINVDFSYSYLGEIMDRNDADADQFKPLSERGKPVDLNKYGGEDNPSGGRVASHELGHNGNLGDRYGKGGLMDRNQGRPLFSDRWNFYRGR